MALDKFELNDIWHVLQPQAINQRKTNKLLERIAVALEKANSLEHILTQDEKDFLCEKKIINKYTKKSKGEIIGERTRKYVKKFNKEKK